MVLCVTTVLAAIALWDRTSSGRWLQRPPRSALPFTRRSRPVFAGKCVREVPGVGNLTGNVIGETLVEEFLNIPYAKPPTDSARFRLAQPLPETWGQRDASEFGPACMQTNSSQLQLNLPQSEDCLQLNVWAPANASGAPVIVWLHSDREGQGSGILANGTSLASRGVIFVSLNYRLGALGYFASPAIADENRASGYPANGALNGVLDQQLALVWVADRIGHFGGDASRVTIMGGESTCAHLYILQSQGLFKGAVVASGSCVWGGQRMLTDTESHTASEAFVRQTDPPTGPGTDEDRLERLRLIPAPQLPDLRGFSAVRYGEDGAFMRSPPGNQTPLFGTGVVVGANSADALCAFSDEQPTTPGALEGRLAGVLGKDDGSAVMSLYDQRWPLGTSPSADAVSQRMINITADACGLCPAVTLVDAVSKAAGGPSTSYLYELAYNTKVGWTDFTPPGGELPYVFGTPQLWDTRHGPMTPDSPVWQEADEQLADSVQDSFASFATTGTPTSKATGPWAPRGGFTALGYNVSDADGVFARGQCQWWNAYRLRDPDTAGRVDALCQWCVGDS
eukprot:Hpha_TRINITY_DN18352_c0_g1::TRINITY_DN18352_c0_g1_i1::g.158229::m.158229/K03929/pnbA; para-nitrobenzyl esterase